MKKKVGLLIIVCVVMLVGCATIPSTITVTHEGKEVEMDKALFNVISGKDKRKVNTYMTEEDTELLTFSHEKGIYTVFQQGTVYVIDVDKSDRKELYVLTEEEWEALDKLFLKH